MNGNAHSSLECDMTGSAQFPVIHRQAEERLQRSRYLALQDVLCIASDSVLYLHGCLPSYYLKQVAQELAGGVEGVQHVINLIKVLRPAVQRPPRLRPPVVDPDIVEPPLHHTWGARFSPSLQPTKGVRIDVSSEPQAE
jgi:hypothetical protein